MQIIEEKMPPLNLGIWRSRPDVSPEKIVSCMAEKARLKQLCEESEPFVHIVLPEIAELHLFVAPDCLDQ